MAYEITILFMSIRTTQKYIYLSIYYALQLYSSDILGSFLEKDVPKTNQLSPIIKRNHVTIWNWIQIYKPTKDHSIQKKESNGIHYRSMKHLLKVSNEYVWLYMVPIEPIDK